MSNQLSKFIQLTLKIIVISVFLNTNSIVQSFPNYIIKEPEALEATISPFLKPATDSKGKENRKQSLYFPDTPDGKIFKTIIERTIDNNLEPAEVPHIIQTVATSLLGAKYQAGLLDKSPQETLVISLQKFDCLLFVESVLAISRKMLPSKDILKEK